MFSYFDKSNNKHTIEDKEISMYVCGPTVYNDVHIGNLRPIIYFSTLANIFKYQNRNVKLIHNITDIDDKIVNRSNELDINWKVLADKYASKYFDVLKELNINNIEFAFATDYVNYFIDVSKELIKKDLAYEVNSGVYLNISKLKEYGCVSNQDLESLNTDTRISNQGDKLNQQDFAILKKVEQSDWTWETKNYNYCIRPGWHLECFGIISKLNSNKQLTLHGGGIDLLFPHHENENALNLALNQQNLSKHWMHVGFITINNQKMSKSLKNIISAQDFIKDHGSNLLQLIYLQTMYSKPINIDDQIIKFSKKVETNLINLIHFLTIYENKNSNYEKTSYLEEFDELITNANITNVFSLLQKIIKDFNSNKISLNSYNSLLIDLTTILNILNINIKTNLDNQIIETVKRINSLEKGDDKFSQIDTFKINNPNLKVINTRQGLLVV